MPQITTQEAQKDFYAHLASLESSGQPGKKNELGYIGLYQMGEAALAEAEYYKKELPPGQKKKGNLYNNDWKGEWLKGVSSKDEFLKSPAVQEEAIRAYHDIVWNKQLKDYQKYVGTNIGGVTLTKAGMMGCAHLVGAKSLKNFINTGGETDREDGNNVKCSDFLRTFASYTQDPLATGQAISSSLPQPVQTTLQIQLQPQQPQLQPVAGGQATAQPQPPQTQPAPSQSAPQNPSVPAPSPQSQPVPAPTQSQQPQQVQSVPASQNQEPHQPQSNAQPPQPQQKSQQTQPPQPSQPQNPASSQNLQPAPNDQSQPQQSTENKQEPQTQPTPQSSGDTHKVESGDTLSSIAAKNKITVEELLKLPGNEKFQDSPDKISPGDEVQIKKTDVNAVQAEAIGKNIDSSNANKNMLTKQKLEEDISIANHDGRYSSFLEKLRTITLNGIDGGGSSEEIMRQGSELNEISKSFNAKEQEVKPGESSKDSPTSPTAVNSGSGENPGKVQNPIPPTNSPNSEPKIKDINPEETKNNPLDPSHLLDHLTQKVEVPQPFGLDATGFNVQSNISPGSNFQTSLGGDIGAAGAHSD